METVDWRQQNIIISSVSCKRRCIYMLCSRCLVDLGDVHIFWVSAVTAGHQVAIVGPWQVWYMGSSRMGVTPGFVPWVVVSTEGDVWRIVELPCQPQPLLVREVQPGVELFVQLTGNRRAPRFALWSRWRWFWCRHCCLVSVARLHCRCVWFAFSLRMDWQAFPWIQASTLSCDSTRHLS